MISDVRIEAAWNVSGEGVQLGLRGDAPGRARWAEPLLQLLPEPSH